MHESTRRSVSHQYHVLSRAVAGVISRHVAVFTIFRRREVGDAPYVLPDLSVTSCVAVFTVRASVREWKPGFGTSSAVYSRFRKCRFRSSSGEPLAQSVGSSWRGTNASQVWLLPLGRTSRLLRRDQRRNTPGLGGSDGAPRHGRGRRHRSEAVGGLNPTRCSCRVRFGERCDRRGGCGRLP